MILKFWTACVAVLVFRDTMSVSSLDIQNEKSKDHIYKFHDKDLRRGSQHIARLHGDLIIGAMLPIHISSAGLCSRLYVDGIMFVEAIVFALRDMKNRNLLPEGIALGYEIRDTCSSVIVAQRHTLDVVNEAMKYETRNNDSRNPYHTTAYSTQIYKQSTNSVIAVVGAGNSEVSVAVNRVLSAFNIPQIGFASTSRFLSEKLRFPSFFRTVPPDTYQVEGIVALFRKFSWNYVGLLVSDGDYGRPLGESFKSLAKLQGICITHERLVPFHVSHDNAKSIVEELNLKTNIEIILVLLPESDAETLLRAMLEVGLRNKTLIASDSWSKAIRDSKFSNVAAGTLGFAHHYSQVKEFEDYFLELKPGTNTWNPWFNETWEHVFDCVLPERYQTRSVNKTFSFHTKKANKQVCKLEEQHLIMKKRQFRGFHYVSNIINAVFAIGNGIRHFCRSENITTSSGSSCAVSLLTSQKLLEILKEMTFKKYDGENMTFDECGDVMGKYYLVNIRPNLTSKNVGIWNGDSLEVDEFEKIWWNTGRQRKPPKGVCSSSCPAGWYKISSMKDPQCCWTCQPCHAGTISDKSGATKCVPCAKNYTTNKNRTACIFIPLNYLDWGSFWTVSIVITALISMIALVCVALLFARYVNTPVVKSSNRELSFLLGVGLFVTFLVPFVFAGKPTNLKCIISQVMFCVGCALALSAMLFRTLRIVLLFQLLNRRRWLLNNKYQIAMTIALTFVELTYCLLWVAVNPPGVKTVIVRPTKRYLVCEFDKYWYGGSHLLLIFLSVVCTALAVRGRKLPKNFNEVRHIGFSMFTFNIVWVVFMCAQYGASLEYDVKINCFAMIISSLMILVLLFGPKVFILLFRAHLNKREEFEAEVRRYSFGVPNRDLSTFSASATSLRRGSAIAFESASPSRSGQFLNVGSGDLNRKRSHSFDAMASRIYQTADRLPRPRCSKGTQTCFYGDVTNTSSLRNKQMKDRCFDVHNEAEPLNMMNSDCNDSSNVVVKLDNDSDFQKAFKLKELNKLNECNSLDTNKATECHNECPQELTNLLADLDVLDKSIPNGNVHSTVPSTEKHPSNGELAPFSKSLNTEHGRQIQNGLSDVGLDWDCDGEDVNSRDFRNRFDRETVL